MAFRERDSSPIERRLRKRYRFICELGSGGMASVYLGRDHDGRLVAVKMMRRGYADDPEALSRFSREASLVADLDHPNIVPTYQVERDADREVAIVRQYVHGRTLREVLRDGALFSFERTTDVLRQIGDALRYAHGRGLVHRDVKPENVFIEEGSGRALLSDFGIARLIEPGADTQLTMVGTTIGTPAYMSPEQIDGKPVDGRSDIYSLGLLGWEMLSGRRPWEGENLYGTIFKQKRENLPRLTRLRPGIPEPLLFAIEGALLKDPDMRWQSADEFLAQLLEGTEEAPPVVTFAADDDVFAADEARATSTQQFRVPDDAAGHAAHEHARTYDRDADSGDDANVAGTHAIDDAPRNDDEATRTVSAVEPDTATSDEGDAEPAFASAGAGDGEWEYPERDEIRVVPPSESALASAPDERPPIILATPRSRRRDVPSHRPSARRALAPAALLVALALGVAGAMHDRATRRSAGGEVARDSVALAARTSARDPTVGDAVARDSTTRERDTVARRADAAQTGSAATALAATPGAAATTPPRAGARPARDRATTSPIDRRCDSPTTADQRACLLALIARNDRALNDTYRRLIHRMRLGAGTHVRDPDPAAVRALRADQRRWVDWRDEECRRRGAASEGALWARSRAACFAEVSRARAAELGRRLSRVASR